MNISINSIGFNGKINPPADIPEKLANVLPELRAMIKDKPYDIYIKHLKPQKSTYVKQKNLKPFTSFTATTFGYPSVKKDGVRLLIKNEYTSKTKSSSYIAALQRIINYMDSEINLAKKKKDFAYKQLSLKNKILIKMGLLDWDEMYLSMLK